VILGELLTITAAGKISKVGAGYVERRGSDYRCRECWLFIPGKQRCATLGQADVVRPNGYCIYWEKGTPQAGLKPMGSYTKLEAGYGELPNGTLCRRCEHFDGRSACSIVAGTIAAGGCCNNQEPA
jgi:hypothetical protein